MITTWKCHICKKERPDSKISVHSFPLKRLVGATRNVRYCNDNPECHLGAIKKEEEQDL